MNELDTLVDNAKAAFAQASAPADLENAKAQFLGKSGRITELMKGMAQLSVEEKKSRGAAINVAKQAIEAQLSNFLDDPKVSVSVYAYNSKVYYVITEGAGLGDLVARLPITGNETVLDAISQINGLSRISSKKIWIARPNRLEAGCDTILPVDWKEITKGAATATNYQVLPGDRIFIAENKLVAFDAALNNVIAPIERIFGVSLLGTQTIQTINRFPLGLSGFGGSSGF